MKILYYTNTKYAWNVQGTTKSIAEETCRRGHTIKIVSRNLIGNILQEIKSTNPDCVWLASSDIRVEQFKKQIPIPVIGFGFSDPYMFSPDRFKSYDIYVTNHEETRKKYSHILPIHYNPTACDLKFHKNLSLEKTIDISCVGTHNHQRFKDPLMRPKMVEMLRKDGFGVYAYGDGWNNNRFNHKAIEGQEFLNVINKSKIGIDLQDYEAPLAHRMLEYGACGTPCITRERPEIYNLFEKNEILTYVNYEDLKEKIAHYLKHEEDLKKFGERLESRCRKDHNITNRIDQLFSFLNGHLSIN